MKVTPLDIRRKEFKRAMRGYSDEEVDIFLDEVADEFERIFRENAELHDRVQRLEEQIAGYVQLKDTLEKTLVTAQLQADEVRANARKESELILRDAELKARQIVNDSYRETQRVQQALVQLKHLEEDFRFKFRSLLEGYLKLLDEVPLASRSADIPIPPETSGAGQEGGPNLEREYAGGKEPPVEEALVAQPTWPAEGPWSEEGRLSGESPETELASALDDTPTEEMLGEAAGPAAANAETDGAAGLGGEGPNAERAAAETVADPERTTGTDKLASSPVTEALGNGRVTEASEDEEEPPQAFYFGRKLDKQADSFFSTSGQAKKESGNRDFEW